nr:MAG TPA: hypothetical protein [Caudoviricetes sp.]
MNTITLFLKNYRKKNSFICTFMEKHLCLHHILCRYL